jgi:cytochrome oxidase Cu insertion factor (SCO1/SenC/PrrC family)
MRRVVIAFFVATLIVSLGACAGETSGNATDGLETRPGEKTDEGAASEAPDFSFETFEGDSFTLAEQRGTPVVINFWESW